MGQRGRGGEKKVKAKLKDDLRKAISELKRKSGTRAEAERLIAATTDLAVLARLASEKPHPNKHVRAKAKYKLAKLSGAERA